MPRINIVNETDGQVISIDQSELDLAQKGGWRLQTPEAAQKTNDKLEFGAGAGNTFAAASLGALRGISLNTSDYLLNKSGIISGRELKALEEQHPAASIAGEALPYAAELIPSLAKTAAVRGATFLARKAASAGAKLSTGIGGEALTKLATKGALGKLLAKGIQTAAEGGAVGGAFGAGAASKQAAQNDDELTAESIFAHGVHGAAWGAGLAAALGTGLAGAMPLLGGALKLAPRIYNKATLEVRRAYAKSQVQVLHEMGEASGASSELAESAVAEPYTQEGMAARENMLQLPKHREEIVKRLQSHMSNVMDQADKVVKETFGTHRPAESADLLKNTNHKPALDDALNVLGTIESGLANMRERPDIYTATSLLGKLELQLYGRNDKGGILDDLTGESARNVFAKMNAFKQRLDAQLKLYDREIPAQEAATVDELRSMRDLVKTHLEKTSSYESAGERQGSFNSVYQRYSIARKNFLRIFGNNHDTATQRIRIFDPVKLNEYVKKIGQARGARHEAALDEYLNSTQEFLDQVDLTSKNAITGPVRESIAHVQNAKREAEDVLGEMALLRSTGLPIIHGAPAIDAIPYVGKIPIIGQSLQSEAQQMSRIMLSGNPQQMARKLLASERANALRRKTIEKAVDSLVDYGEKKANGVLETTRRFAVPVASSIAAQQPEVEQKIERINALAANPQQIVDGAQQLTDGLDGVSPELATHMASKYSTAIQFLAEKTPKSRLSEAAINPLQRKQKPNAMELSKFKRYLNAVENPLSVINNIAKGDISSEGAETLRVVYPKIYQELVSSISERASTLKHELPYHYRVALSRLFGTPLDDSLAPDNFKTIQTSLDANELAKQQTEQAAAQGAAHNLSQSNDSMTYSQRAQQR